MPVVLREGGYRVEFYSSDADEPPHVHVKKNGKHAKLWLQPVVTVATSQRFRPHEINRILRLVEEHRDALVESWYDYFRSRT